MIKINTTAGQVFIWRRYIHYFKSKRDNFQSLDNLADMQISIKKNIFIKRLSCLYVFQTWRDALFCRTWFAITGTIFYWWNARAYIFRFGHKCISIVIITSTLSVCFNCPIAWYLLALFSTKRFLPLAITGFVAEENYWLIQIIWTSLSVTICT